MSTDNNQLPPLTATELAAEIKRLHNEYARTRVPGPELFAAIDRLAALAQRPVAWQPMKTAPKDGSLLRLLVEFTENQMDDDNEPQATIGMNNLGNTQEDVWQFAGWSWCHDRFTQGEGTPIGWLPLIDTVPATAEQPAEPMPEGYKLVLVPDAQTDEPDWEECIRQVEVATGLTVERNTISIFIREVRRWLAATAPAPVAPPEGWRLVPIEPTREMLDAYVARTVGFQSGRSDWRAMIDAAPAAPVAPMGLTEREAFQKHYGPSEYENDPLSPKREAFGRGFREGIAAMSAAPPAPAGFKLLKDTTHDERSWPEDGKPYFQTCRTCLREFTGHKRRVSCRACSPAMAASSAPEGKAT